jgi:hypothetical protein
MLGPSHPDTKASISYLVRASEWVVVLIQGWFIPGIWQVLAFWFSVILSLLLLLLLINIQYTVLYTQYTVRWVERRQTREIVPRSTCSHAWMRNHATTRNIPGAPCNHDKKRLIFLPCGVASLILSSLSLYLSPNFLWCVSNSSCRVIPAMASSQGDVRPSPMAYIPSQRCGRCPKLPPSLPLPLRAYVRPDTGPTS